MIVCTLLHWSKYPNLSDGLANEDRRRVKQLLQLCFIILLASILANKVMALIAACAIQPIAASKVHVILRFG